MKIFPQTSSNELECCQKQCKCCCWWTTKPNNISHLFNNWYLDSTALTHIFVILCALAGAIRPKWRAFSEIGARSFRLYYGHPQLAGKRLVRAKQRTQFRAKSAKNDLKPTDLVNRNFYFETEGVASTKVSIMHSPSSYAASFLAGGKTHLSSFKVCEELLLNSQKGSWRRRPQNCFFYDHTLNLQVGEILGLMPTVCTGSSWLLWWAKPLKFMLTTTSGGALYIMFENHVRSWPLLKTPWYTRGRDLYASGERKYCKNRKDFVLNLEFPKNNKIMCLEYCRFYQK